MRAVFVVILAPLFDLLLCVLNGHKPALIQAFLPQATIEPFDEGVVCWLARAAEMKPNSFSMNPLVQSLRSEVRTVVNFFIVPPSEMPKD